MKRYRMEIKDPKKQSGAALIVGLVLLMVLTLLAVTSMTTSTTEVSMAQNAKFTQNAFQSAETGIDIAIASSNWSTTTAFTVPPTPIGGDIGNLVEYELRFDEATDVPTGFSIGAGTGFRSYHFNVESTGISSRGATSTHEQSFYIIGPGSN